MVDIQRVLSLFPLRPTVNGPFHSELDLQYPITTHKVMAGTIISLMGFFFSPPLSMHHRKGQRDVLPRFHPRKDLDAVTVVIEQWSSPTFLHREEHDVNLRGWNDAFTVFLNLACLMAR